MLFYHFLPRDDTIYHFVEKFHFFAPSSKVVFLLELSVFIVFVERFSEKW
jgi:hypothetical protein